MQNWACQVFSKQVKLHEEVKMHPWLQNTSGMQREAKTCSVSARQLCCYKLAVSLHMLQWINKRRPGGWRKCPGRLQHQNSTHRMSQKSAAIKLKVAEWGDKKELSVIYGTALRLTNTATVLSRRACHTHTMQLLMISLLAEATAGTHRCIQQPFSIQECIHTVNDPPKKKKKTGFYLKEMVDVFSW